MFYVFCLNSACPGRCFDFKNDIFCITIDTDTKKSIILASELGQINLILYVMQRQMTIDEARAKDFINLQGEVTSMLKNWLDRKDVGQDDIYNLCKFVNISKATLYRRLISGTWTPQEVLGVVGFITREKWGVIE